MKSLDLDVDAPERVANVLRNAAQAYYESHSELSAAWQDRKAGRVWFKLGAEFEKFAERIAAVVERNK